MSGGKRRKRFPKVLHLRFHVEAKDKICNQNLQGSQKENLFT